MTLDKNRSMTLLLRAMTPLFKGHEDSRYIVSITCVVIR